MEPLPDWPSVAAMFTGLHMDDAIKLTTILSHADIRDAARRGVLNELLGTTVAQIQIDLAKAVARWLETQKPRATRRDSDEG